MQASLVPLMWFQRVLASLISIIYVLLSIRHSTKIKKSLLHIIFSSIFTPRAFSTESMTFCQSYNCHLPVSQQKHAPSYGIYLSQIMQLCLCNSLRTVHNKAALWGWSHSEKDWLKEYLTQLLFITLDSNQSTKYITLEPPRSLLLTWYFGLQLMHAIMYCYTYALVTEI